MFSFLLIGPPAYGYTDFLRRCKGVRCIYRYISHHLYDCFFEIFKDRRYRVGARLPRYSFIYSYSQDETTSKQLDTICYSTWCTRYIDSDPSPHYLLCHASELDLVSRAKMLTRTRARLPCRFAFHVNVTKLYANTFCECSSPLSCLYHRLT